MPARENAVTTYLTDAEKRQLEQWAEKSGKSQSDLVRDAIMEYTDRDRVARIEDKLDRTLSLLSDETHTHTENELRNASIPETARAIAKRIYKNHDAPIKGADVELAIEDLGGADDRTLDKYKRQLKKRGLLYKHPLQPVWTDEKQEWVGWVEGATVNSDVHEVTEKYDMDSTEYNEIADRIQS